MKRSNTSGLGLWCSGLLAVIVIGCGGQADEPTAEADPSGDVVAEDEELRHWRRPWRPRPPGTGGTDVVTPPKGGSSGTGQGSGGASGSGGAPTGNVDCDICATAQACCNTVSGGPLCTFSVSTCESLDDVRRAGYVKGCRTLLDTTRRAWKSPPSTCR